MLTPIEMSLTNPTLAVRKSPRRCGIVLLALTLAISCRASDVVVCPADPPRVRITPDALSLAVGQSSSPRARAFVCGGTQEVAWIGRWRSADSAIARIDTLTGLVTARARGTTVVYGQWFGGPNPAGGLYDSVLVTVR
jgi:hypothetical protein